MALCVCLAVAGSAVSQDKDMPTFKTDDGRLTFWSPVAPRKTSDRVPGKERRTYLRTTYAVEMPNYLLLASVLDLGDDPPTTGDEQAYLGSMVRSLTGNMGDKFVLDPKDGQTRLHYGGSGFPGRQVKGTLEGQQLIIRSYVAPRRIYTFQVGYRLGDKEAAADGERFLASVLINDS
jgi:hypothetical protein